MLNNAQNTSDATSIFLSMDYYVKLSDYIPGSTSYGVLLVPNRGHYFDKDKGAQNFSCLFMTQLKYDTEHYPLVLDWDIYQQQDDMGFQPITPFGFSNTKSKFGGWAKLTFINPTGQPAFQYPRPDLYDDCVFILRQFKAPY
jgi:hypothetical protein